MCEGKVLMDKECSKLLSALKHTERERSLEAELPFLDGAFKEAVTHGAWREA